MISKKELDGLFKIVETEVKKTTQKKPITLDKLKEIPIDPSFWEALEGKKIEFRDIGGKNSIPPKDIEGLFKVAVDKKIATLVSLILKNKQFVDHFFNQNIDPDHQTYLLSLIEPMLKAQMVGLGKILLELSFVKNYYGISLHQKGVVKEELNQRRLNLLNSAISSKNGELVKQLWGHEVIKKVVIENKANLTVILTSLIAKSTRFPDVSRNCIEDIISLNNKYKNLSSKDMSDVFNLGKLKQDSKKNHPLRPVIDAIINDLEEEVAEEKNSHDSEKSNPGNKDEEKFGKIKKKLITDTKLRQLKSSIVNMPEEIKNNPELAQENNLQAFVSCIQLKESCEFIKEKWEKLAIKAQIEMDLEKDRETIYLLATICLINLSNTQKTFKKIVRCSPNKAMIKQLEKDLESRISKPKNEDSVSSYTKKLNQALNEVKTRIAYLEKEEMEASKLIEEPLPTVFFPYEETLALDYKKRDDQINLELEQLEIRVNPEMEIEYRRNSIPFLSNQDSPLLKKRLLQEEKKHNDIIYEIKKGYLNKLENEISNSKWHAINEDYRANIINKLNNPHHIKNLLLTNPNSLIRVDLLLYECMSILEYQNELFKLRTEELVLNNDDSDLGNSSLEYKNSLINENIQQATKRHELEMNYLRNILEAKSQHSNIQVENYPEMFFTDKKTSFYNNPEFFGKKNDNRYQT